MRLLVTGFGPFPTMPRNPSAALAKAVASSPRFRIRGIEAACLIVTTAYASIAGELAPALSHEPDAVLMIGVAGRSRRVRVERRATSRRSTLFPDAAGATAAIGRGVAPSDDRRTAVNPLAATRILREHRVPAGVSRNAGRYLCNAAYFHALGREGPTLFVHIPKPRHRRVGRRLERLSERDRMVAAHVAIALVMVRDARRRATLPHC